MTDAQSGGAAGGDAGGSTTTTPQGGDASGGDAGRTFTQAELDKIVGQRVARERSQFADYDELKTKAGEFDRLAESQKSEVQKATDKAAAAERRALQLEAEIVDTRLRSTVTSAAARKGIIDPDAAFALLDRAALTFDKAGTPTNLDAVLDELAKAKPYLVGTTGRPGPGAGSGVGGPRGGAAPGPVDPIRELWAARNTG